MTSPGTAPVESVRVASDSSRPACVPWLIGLVVLALLALALLLLLDDDEQEQVDQISSVS